MIINTQIKGGAGSGHYIDKEPDANGKLVNKNPIDLAGIRDLGDDIFLEARKSSTYTGELFANATELTTISGTNTMLGIGMASRITSMTLPNLVSITGSLSGVVNSNTDAPWYASDLQTLNLPALTTVSGEKALNSFCWGATNLTNVDLSSLTTISGNSACYSMFSGCNSLTSADLSSLTTISGNSACHSMFYNCTGLTSVDLSSLTTVSGSKGCQYMFQNTGLTNVDLSSLTTISDNNACYYMFSDCASLSTIIINHDVFKRNPAVWFANSPLTTFLFDKTEYITSTANGLAQGQAFVTANMDNFEFVNVSATNMFKGNTNLQNAYFPVLTRWNGAGNAAGMFEGCTNANFTDVYFPMLCVMKNAAPFTSTSFPSQLTVHFRKDQQTLLEGTTGYPFGASACVFDQIGTITVNGTDYIREGKCNETGYYAWHKATSSITVDGITYTYDQPQITRNIVPVIAGPMLYGWTSGSTTIYTDSLKPQVGDFIYTAYNVAQSTTQSISAIDNEYVYTVDSAEPVVGDNVYSDTGTTLIGTISSIA